MRNHYMRQQHPMSVRRKGQGLAATLRRPLNLYPPTPVSHLPSPGQAMVEMAIVIGILLLVILGGLDVLQIQMTQYTVSQAVRAAAHQAALIGGPDGQNGSWGDGARPSGTVADTARVILDS